MDPQWIVAGTEICLAAGTVYLGVQARSEAGSVKSESAAVFKQVELQREAIDVSARAIVIPVPPVDWFDFDPAHPPFSRGGRQPPTWVTHLRIKNVGPAVALNITGQVHWGPPTGIHADFSLVALGPGEDELVYIARAGSPLTEWDGVTGWVKFMDATTAHWQSTFDVETDPVTHYPRRLVVQTITFLGRDRDGTAPRPA